VAWSRQTFWFKPNFLLPKNESVLNILGYFLKQFQIFSRIYPKMFSTDFIFRQQENLVDIQKYQAGFRPLCNKIPWLKGNCSKWISIFFLRKVKLKWQKIVFSSLLILIIYICLPWSTHSFHPNWLPYFLEDNII
jgi:hypothetical protein